MATKTASPDKVQNKSLALLTLRVSTELRAELTRAALEQSLIRDRKISLNELVNEFCRAGLEELAKRKHR
ncbi:hypothetical protein PP724_22960 [Ralstonia solanacearum]|uniref:hypothetical protein n=1 Tax=Ralstonia solanacearum TaxID=305 RepID=UPI001FFBB9B5|nr:hypothetical protein [Ralstonia solanacearum]MDC6237028.1 hypothetical protein [Ralstonia solanacearum]MDD7810569.1 hypothetical protein [Ralstonia solanacearum]